MLKLLEHLGRVYDFMMQDETLREIPSMQGIVGRIVKQTLECSQFIGDYSTKKQLCEDSTNYCASFILNLHNVIIGKKLGKKNIPIETDRTIQQYSNVFQELVQDFRNQAVQNVPTSIHRSTGKDSYVCLT